ncbi:hypothetical protein EMCRGX_G001570 [Ephydatia muelleri]
MSGVRRRGEMLSFFQSILEWFKSLFWKEEMEITLVGLQNSGKTSFVNVIATGQFSDDMIPTVGFNMRKVTKGNATIKLWDIGADHEKLETSKTELLSLLEKPQLAGIPVLVLGNKVDLPNALKEKELTERLGLTTVVGREVCCYSISCKERENIETTLQWLIQTAKNRRS